MNSVAESTGYTALHYAAKHGQLGAIDALVEAGGDVNALDGVRNGTPLHAAIGFRDCEATLLSLLRHGAREDSTRKDKKTPLCVAVAVRNRVAVDTLLSAGADENLPLFLLSAASVALSEEMVLALVGRGADVNAKRASVYIWPRKRQSRRTWTCS